MREFGFQMRSFGFTVIFFVCFSFPHHLVAENFSCLLGKRGACLDYGDKVCSQFSKCVSEDAICLEPYQCNYEGFTCKSNVTKLIDDYNNLAGDCQELQDSFQVLSQQYDQQSSQIDILLSRVSELKRELRDTEDMVIIFKSCVQNAETIDEAQYCSP